MSNTPGIWNLLLKALPASALTGIGGYLVHVFQSARGKGRMREQLYREISRNYQRIVVRIALVTSIPGIRTGAPFRFNERLDLSFGVWNFYYDEKRRDRFFELSEAEAVTRIYMKFAEIGNEDRPGYAHVRGKEAAAEIDDCILDRTLNRRLYRRVSSEDAWKFMEDLISGRRESHRVQLSSL